MNAIRALAIVTIISILLTPAFSAPVRAEGEPEGFGAPTFVKSYTLNPAPPAGTTVAYYKITNSSSYLMTDMAFSDVMSDRFEFIQGSVKNNCGGTVSFPNHYTVELSKGLLAPNAVCDVAVPIRMPNLNAVYFTSDLYLTAKGFVPVDAPTVKLVVGKQEQTIDFGPIAETLMVAMSVIKLTATASSGLPVAFAAEGACELSGKNTLTLTHGDAVCAVTATQAGDALYNAAPPEKYTFTVVKAPQTIDFGPIPEELMVATSVIKLTASASSGLPVSFAAAGACELSGKNRVTLKTGNSSCTITATQPGDTRYSPAPAVKHTFQIGKASQAIDFPAIPDTTIDKQFITLNPTASSGLPVEYNANGYCKLIEDDLVAFFWTGKCTIIAKQSGDATYHPASEVKRTFTILKANQTITFAKLPDRMVADAPFKVEAESSLKLYDLVLPITFSASGECSVKGDMVALSGKPGTCTITANQPGHPVVHPAKSVSRTFAITSSAKQSQTITFAALPGRTVGDGPFQLSASASSGLPVSFSAEGECSVSGSTVTLSGQPGSCTITASQQGDATYNPASVVTQGFTIAPAGGPAPTPSPAPSPSPDPAPAPSPEPAPHTVYLPLLSR